MRRLYTAGSFGRVTTNATHCTTTLVPVITTITPSSVLPLSLSQSQAQSISTRSYGACDSSCRWITTANSSYRSDSHSCNRNRNQYSDQYGSGPLYSNDHQRRSLSIPSSARHYKEDTVDIRKILSACHDLAQRAGGVVRHLMDSGENVHLADKSAPLPPISSSSSSSNGSTLSTLPSSSHQSCESLATIAHLISPNLVHRATKMRPRAARLAAVHHPQAPAPRPEDVDDPQTAADVISQQVLIGSLRRLWPTLQVVGEEGELELCDEFICHDVQLHRMDHISFPPHLLNVPIHDITLWIDPVDATRELTLGHKECVTVLIGISIRGVATAGVVHVPFINPRTVWGALGVGVHDLDCSPNATAAVSLYPHLRPGLPQYESPSATRKWLITSSHHRSAHLQTLLDTRQVSQLLQLGGAGSKGLMVLEQHADIYFFPQWGTKRWDTCAIDALFHAQGGKFTDSFGVPINYTYVAGEDPNNRHGLLATRDASCHQQFVLPLPRLPFR